jgi:ArsR family transcriptional regulator, arsenate/arsenite/antimonite-responsive transcriptional repressor
MPTSWTIYLWLSIFHDARNIDECQYVAPGKEAMSVLELPVLGNTSAVACCAPLASEVVSVADAEALSRQFSALADPVRLRLVSLLATASGGGVCACELVGPAGKSQPTVSHHLKVLSEAGLVASERRGRNIWYAVVPTALAALREVLAPGQQ